MANLTQKPTTASPQTSRRKFTKATLALALSVAPLRSLAEAQTPSTTKQAPAPPNPTTTAAAAAPSNPSPLAEVYAEAARTRFGNGLTPDEVARIRRDMESNVRTAERLRAFKLKNSDEPDFIFRA